MVAVPADTPVILPAESTATTVVSLLAQVPPDTLSVSIAVESTDTVVAPVIVPAEGMAITVSAAVALTVPQLLVTE